LDQIIEVANRTIVPINAMKVPLIYSFQTNHMKQGKK